jgi:hypothetical protein
MSQRIAYALALAALLALAASRLVSAEAERAPTPAGVAPQERAPTPGSGAPPEQAPKPGPEAEAGAAADLPCPRGWQLMTPEEMRAHHARLRAARTPAEREQIRSEHHAQMVERARERGVSLPAAGGPCPGWPGRHGRGMGPGMGMGPGGGMGPGPGAGPGGPAPAPEPKSP